MQTDNNDRDSLFSIFNSFGLRPTVLGYTRITQTCQKCIDNIFTNWENVEPEIFNYHLSDHAGQKVIFKVNKVKANILLYKRFFTVDNKMYFRKCLKEQNWLEVYSQKRTDVNEQWSVFILTFLNIFNHCFPKKPAYSNRKKRQSLFVSNEVADCKRKLDNLLVLSQKYNTYKNEYKKVKKDYDTLLAKERSDKYSDKILNSDNKIGTVWSICHEVTGKMSTSNECNLRGDPQTIADNMNQHLINIIPELLKSLKDIPFTCDIPDQVQSLYLRPVEAEELLSCATKLKNKFSSGEDEIPACIVKSCLEDVAEVVCYIINNSMKYGIFPDQLKFSLIIPIHKKDSVDLNNYRPISLLPSFSKIFELVILSRILSYAKKFEIFSQTQHGYLEGKSTTTAI